MSLDELERASRLLALHLTEAVSRLGSAALDVIDLPPLSEADVEPAQLRAAAALFWAMHVDRAGVLEVVDALVEGSRSGRYALATGSLFGLFFGWHRRRQERLSASERGALYERVFGAEEVRRRLHDLLELLGRVAATRLSTPESNARVSVCAEELAVELSTRGAGVTAFAAREIVESIREALAILQRPELLAAFGRRSAQDLLAAVGPTIVGRALNPAASFARARAGQELLSWLADAAPVLSAGGLTIDPDEPVVHAASAWLATTPTFEPPPTAPAVVPRLPEVWA